MALTDKVKEVSWDIPPPSRCVYTAPTPEVFEEVDTWEQMWADSHNADPTPRGRVRCPKTYWAGAEHLLTVRCRFTRMVPAFRTKPSEAQVEAWVERFREREGQYPDLVLICGSDEGLHGDPPGYGILLLGDG